MLELQKKIRAIIESLIAEHVNMSVISGCEIFVRYITLCYMDYPVNFY